jgi:hypothetical protein
MAVENSSQIPRIQDSMLFLRIKNLLWTPLIRTSEKLLMVNLLKNRRSKEERCMRKNENDGLLNFHLLGLNTQF